MRMDSEIKIGDRQTREGNAAPRPQCDQDSHRHEEVSLRSPQSRSKLCMTSCQNAAVWIPLWLFDAIENITLIYHNM